MQLLYFVSDNLALKLLSEKAATRTQAAFQPKTKEAHSRMFEIFLAFCICMDVLLISIDVKVILSFLRCLVKNKHSTAMISNYVSAMKACFELYDLPYHLLDHPKVRFFQKSMLINRPLALV